MKRKLVCAKHGREFEPLRCTFACPNCVADVRERVRAELWRANHAVFSERPSADWFRHWPTFTPANA